MPACAACRRCCVGQRLPTRPAVAAASMTRTTGSVAERQEGIPVAPAEREHAESLHVRATDVVVDAGQQLHFLGAVSYTHLDVYKRQM